MHRSADPAEAQHARSTDRTSDGQHSRHGQPFQRHGHRHHGHRQQLNDRASPPEMHKDYGSSHQQAQYRQATDHQHRMHDRRVHTSNAVSMQRDQLPLQDPHQAGAGSSIASPRQYPGKASYKRRMSAEPLQPFPEQSRAHPPSSKRIYPGKSTRPDSAELMFDQDNGPHQQMPQRSYPSRSTRDGEVPIPGRSSAQQRQPERVYPGRIGSDEAASFGRDAHASVAQHESRQPPSYSYGNHPRDQTRDQQPPIRSYPGKHSDSGRAAVGRGASEAAWPAEEEHTQGSSRQRQYPSHRDEQLFDDGQGAEPNWHDEASQHINRGRKLDSNCHLQRADQQSLTWQECSCYSVPVVRHKSAGVSHPQLTQPKRACHLTVYVKHSEVFVVPHSIMCPNVHNDTLSSTEMVACMSPCYCCDGWVLTAAHHLNSNNREHTCSSGFLPMNPQS